MELYETGSSNELVALPVNTPKLPKGLSGNVDTIAGLRLTVKGGRSATAAQAVAAPVDGGTPSRTGSRARSCVDTQFPAALTSGAGLFPDQIATAYGIAALQAAGLKGQNARVAIVGEAPTRAQDVDTFRSCFGLTGMDLKMHNAGSIQPILESSLDARRCPPWRRSSSASTSGCIPSPRRTTTATCSASCTCSRSPVQATTNGAPLPHVTVRLLRRLRVDREGRLRVAHDRRAPA